LGYHSPMHQDTIITPTERLQANLQALKTQNAYRFCREVEPEKLPMVQVNLKQVNLKKVEKIQTVYEKATPQSAILFCGNDYLGLSQDHRLQQAAREALEQYGTGAGASRLVSGTTSLCNELEQAVAQFKHTEFALVFNSGYQANVGNLSALLQENDWAIGDKLNHASLVDGCLLAQSLNKANWTRYAHLDLNHLESKLKQIQAKRKPGAAIWIITDSVFSMDGDVADLTGLVTLAKQYDAFTYVDEAHATGLYGESRSSGQCEAQGVSDDITLQMGTFSKALGSSGAYIAGGTLWREWLINHARSLIYSTALPAAVLAANLKALEVIQTDPNPKRQLWENIRYATHWLSTHFPEREIMGQSPILPWIIGHAEQTMALSQHLLDAGYFVQGIRPPTVPEGTARLRITLSSYHEKSHLDGLFEALQQYF
jgi:8-amino-7-oxononanoate synthase